MAQAALLPNACQLDLSVEDAVDSAQPLLADKTKIKQILTNLIANSIRFTASGGKVKLVSKLEQVQSQNYWSVSVVDTGIGIAQSELQRIFLPFTQVSQGANRRYGGTGLGLTLSQVIAKALGGQISVKSVLGQGSEFTLQIRVALPNKYTLTKGRSASESRQDFKSLKILLVEDHSLNARITARLLQGYLGVTPTVVSSGEAAIDLLEAGNLFDVIFMDINLGEGKTGLQTAQAIRQQYGQASPVMIALTAGVLPEEKDQVYRAGMDGFLSKPLEPEQLGKELQKAFSLGRKLAS